MLGYHASGIPLFLHDSTGAYATRQGNDHYFYHNAAMTVATSNGCPTSTVTRECSLDQKKDQGGVRIDWWVHISHVWTMCPLGYIQVVR